MSKQTLIKRLEIAEEALKSLSKFSADCICFPENEQPFFCTESEAEIAARLKCPLHGDRFKHPIFHIYVAKWRRESEVIRRQQLSEQYRKAWAATLPLDVYSQEEF